MLKFEPPELLTKICKAAQKFEESCTLHYGDGYPFFEQGFDPADYHEDGDDDEIINNNTQSSHKFVNSALEPSLL